MQIEENIALAPLTTFQIGGSARFFARIRSIEDAKEAVQFSHDHNVPLMVLGGGSNILVRDSGFHGLVIKIEIKDFSHEEGNRDTTVIAGAGENWDDLVDFSVRQNLWGIENLSCIPGTVGGAVVQNVGAYDMALSQTLLWVEVFEVPSGTIRKLFNDECEFGYRTSIFKKNPDTYIILRAAFCLPHGGKPNLSYRDLAEAFKGKNPVELGHIRGAVCAIRAGKFPDISQEGTAGSFFLNPIVPESEARALAQKLPSMPVFALPEALGIKIPLGYLLDKGLKLRGFSKGKVRLFEKQALVIVATRGATAAEVIDLANEVSKKIYDEYQISIEPEVRIV